MLEHYLLKFAAVAVDNSALSRAFSDNTSALVQHRHKAGLALAFAHRAEIIEHYLSIFRRETARRFMNRGVTFPYSKILQKQRNVSHRGRHKYNAGSTSKQPTCGACPRQRRDYKVSPFLPSNPVPAFKGEIYGLSKTLVIALFFVISETSLRVGNCILEIP